MLYNEEEGTPAVIVTNATESDKLIQQLLLISLFQNRLNQFIDHGQNKGMSHTV